MPDAFIYDHLRTPRGRGKVDGSEIKYQAPNEIGEGTVWIVVHDNRGGASWVQIPLHVH